MIKKSQRMMWIAAALSLLYVFSVYAADPEGASVISQTTAGELPAFTAESVNVEAGNITKAVIEANMSTIRWAGLIGNVSGNIQLGDASANLFFNWVGIGNLVYACEAAVAWSTLQDVVNETVVTAYPAIGTGSDNYSLTFTGVNESIGSSVFSALYSDYAATLSSGSTTWKTYSLSDGTDIVFAAKVVDNGVAYDGETVDFQMILPEDGTAEDETVTSWDLYVELK